MFIWNRREFYWFDKLLFYGMQVYYRNDFPPFLNGCFCFIIGKLLRIDVYKIIRRERRQRQKMEKKTKTNQKAHSSVKHLSFKQTIPFSSITMHVTYSPLGFGCVAQCHEKSKHTHWQNNKIENISMYIYIYTTNDAKPEHTTEEEKEEKTTTITTEGRCSVLSMIHLTRAALSGCCTINTCESGNHTMQINWE